MIYYFSGNGNSKAVAKRIAHDLDEKLVFIMDAIGSNDYSITLSKGESLGFIWPVYCWAPPKLVTDFLKKLEIKYQTKPYVYFVSTYGDCAGKTEDIFRKALSKKGLSLDGAFGVQMPETYINFGKMALDTPEVREEKLKAAGSVLPQIIEDIRAKKTISRIIEGGMPLINSYIVRPIFYKFLVTDKKWIVTDDCIGCKTCEKVCPLGNITVDKKPSWKGNCTTCEACYHSCPKNAIQFGKTTLGKGQYKFPDEDIYLK